MHNRANWVRIRPSEIGELVLQAERGEYSPPAKFPHNESHPASCVGIRTLTTQTERLPQGFRTLADSRTSHKTEHIGTTSYHEIGLDLFFTIINSFKAEHPRMYINSWGVFSFSDHRVLKDPSIH